MKTETSKHLKQINKIKAQLLQFDIKQQNGMCWADIIAKDPQHGLKKWHEQSKKANIERSVIESKLQNSIEEYRNIKLAEIKTMDFKYYCSICLIIRDENEYLEEWLNWHIGQGVEHFYIYDHGSKEPVAEFVKNLAKEIENKITLIDFSGTHENAQLEAYNDCLKQFATESYWIGFIDADEMVRVKNGKLLSEFLKDYEDYAGVMAQWVLYDAGGQVKKTDKPLRERFINISPADKQYNLGKVFLQSLLTLRMVIHNGYAIEYFNIVDEQKAILADGIVEIPTKDRDLICVDHYFTKSYEEWIEKIKRGSCDPNYNRRYLEFFRYNPDMIHCKEDFNFMQEYEVSTK